MAVCNPGGNWCFDSHLANHTFFNTCSCAVCKSSPKFHQMLIDHPWFGSLLRQWEKNRTVSRRIKIRASVLIVLSFSVSIAVLQDNPLLQTMLILIAIICLYYIWRLKEPNRP